MKKIVKDYLWLFIGAFLFCAGLNWFIVPAGLYNGGAVGISQIIRTLLNLDTTVDIAGIINFIINVPLLAIAYQQFGKVLFMKTAFIIVLQTIFFTILRIPATPLVNEYMAACLMGGLVSGVGVGLTLKAGGSGGGVDIIGLYCAYRYKGFSVGKFSVIFNGIVYILCAVLFDISIAIYSVIYSFIYSFVVDRVHLQSIGVSVMIFTKKDSVRQDIIEYLNRGATYWMAKGAYTDQDTYVIVTALSMFEVRELKRMLATSDPQAFVLVTEQKEILGNYELRL